MGFAVSAPQDAHSFVVFRASILLVASGDSKRIFGKVSIVDFEAEGDEPVVGCLLFDIDFFDGRFGRDFTVVTSTSP
jgi:hypothetical protein